MNENIQKMLELLSQDEEAMKKLSAIHDPDEAYALVTAIHGGYTKEEFTETVFLSVTSAFSGAVSVTAAAASAI